MINLKISEKEVEHSLFKTVYIIGIIGAKYVGNKGEFKLEFKNINTGNIYTAKKHLVTQSVNVHNKIGVNYGSVDILEGGQYKIRLLNIEDLLIDSCSIPLKSWLFPSSVKLGDFSILLRRYYQVQ